ncbi:transposase [Bradyrhizobium elkanii]
MAPLRGWAPRGRRLHAKVPHGRWKTMTFLAALRHDRIDAPWFIEGPIDGVSFRTYVEKVLLPVLRPGDIVILDNLGSHRSKAVRQLIRSVGAKLFFLPKYSPDLNPIEQVFAKLKHLVRKAAARTVERGLRRNRPRTRCLHLRGMCQLPQKLRLSNLMPSRFRAFSSEVDTGSREENASKQESRAPFRFHRNGKSSGEKC